MRIRPAHQRETFWLFPQCFLVQYPGADRPGFTENILKEDNFRVGFQAKNYGEGEGCEGE